MLQERRGGLALLSPEKQTGLLDLNDVMPESESNPKPKSRVMK